MTTPMWITYLAALLTPVLAVFGAYIAWRQWRTAQSKVTLDLFDRRYAVYIAVQRTLNEIVKHGQADPQVMQDYMVGTQGARWLFDEELAMYLGALYGRLIHIEADTISARPYLTESGEVFKHREASRRWLIEQRSALDGIFAKHMKLR